MKIKMAETTATLKLETNNYAIKIENFEGPLDLLCHLIEKNKVSIFDVKISDITDQYIDYIDKMQEMKLEVTSEFLVMASMLLYIKSKKVLPNAIEENEEDITEEELLRRIADYKRYKEVSRELKFEFDNAPIRYYRGRESIELPHQELENDYVTNDLVKAYQSLFKRNKEKVNENAANIEKIAITDNYTVASKVRQILKVLIKKPKFVFNTLFSISKCNKEELVTAFSGLLELSRRSRVTTEQEKMFGDIVVEKCESNDTTMNMDNMDDFKELEEGK